MNVVRSQTGWIEVICGSMFSGKTEELIRRIRRVELAKQKYQIFKPNIDTRYSKKNIVSHNQNSLCAQAVETAQELYRSVHRDTQVIGIDEAQFFDSDIITFCDRLANEGKRIIIAGLDQDYQGRPFGPMPALLAIAEYVTKTLAICMKCGNPANKTQRLVDNNTKILVGEQDMYEARCRNCFDPHHTF